jgi:hypothetical protein
MCDQLAKENAKLYPLFYYNVGSYLLSKKENVSFGLQFISNQIEIEIANIQFMRILAFKYEQLQKLEYAVSLYEKVLEFRFVLS